MFRGIADGVPVVHALSGWSAAGFVLLAVLALLATRRIPPLGLALLILADPFAAYHGIGPTTITLQKAVLAGVFAGVLLAGIARTPRRALPLWCAFGLTIAATALSAVHAGDRAVVVRETLKQVEYLLLAWCGCTIAAASETPLIEQVLCSATTLSVGVVGTIAVCEAVIGGAPSGIWFDNIAIPRVAGPLEGPNQLAGFLEVTLPVIVLAPAYVEITAGVRAVASVVAYAALVLTQSRTGIAVVVLQTLAAVRLDRAAFARAGRAATAGVVAGGAIAAAWYGIALVPLLSGRSTQIVVTQPPSHGGTTGALPAGGTVAVSDRIPGEPRVPYVGPTAPVRILAARVTSAPLDAGNRLYVRMITTSNAAAATVRIGSASRSLHRTAFGVFDDSVDVSYAAAPTPKLRVELAAIRADDERARTTVALDVRFDPRRVRIESFNGLRGAGDMVLARAIDTQRLQDPGTVGSRHTLWHAAWVMFRRSPLTGVGAGNYERLLPETGLPGVHTNASSLWLQALAEQGIAGAAALVALVGAVAIGLLRRPRTWWTTAALLATAGFFAHQFLDNLIFFPKVGAPYWILIGVAFGAGVRPRGDEEVSAAA